MSGAGDAAPRRPQIPAAVIGLSSIAMIFLAAGACGLAAPEAFPAVSRPPVAWSLVAVGLMLDVAASIAVIRANRH